MGYTKGERGIEELISPACEATQNSVKCSSINQVLPSVYRTVGSK